MVHMCLLAYQIKCNLRLVRTARSPGSVVAARGSIPVGVADVVGGAGGGAAGRSGWVVPALEPVGCI
jgi:hypothetical protein